jgi:TolA-binding protein
MEWFEIFKAGTHTDSAGQTRTWTEADLDTIVSRYDPGDHEAPVVIGHPKDNSPAWGWIEELKREGNTLYAKAKDLVPEFVEMVKKGLFKKRSISLYPDLTLRHVGFLGAMPPAVKGLADVAFAETQATTIEFDEGYRVNLVGRVFQRMREWLIEKFDTDTADRVVGQWEIDELKREPPPAEEAQGAAFQENAKEEDMDKIAELEARIAQLQGEVSQFAERDRAKEQQIADLTKQLDAERTANRRQEHASFCDGLVTEGKLTPAQKTLALDFMEILHDTAEYEFAEGDGKVKKAPLEAFKGFLQTLPKQVEFGEHATKGRATETGAGSAAEKLDRYAREKMEKDANLVYGAAFSEAQKEHPELAEEYAGDVSG